MTATPFDPNEGLIDPQYLDGAPGPVANENWGPVFDGTAQAGDIYDDARLGNHFTERRIERVSDLSGQENITFGTLLQTNYNWGEYEWTCFTMSSEALQYIRPIINDKIKDNFYYLELAVTPVARWKQQLIAAIETKMDELGPLYQEFYKGFDLRDKGLAEEKSILVNSEFPQARLQMEQQDYADNSTEKESNKVAASVQLDDMITFQKNFQDINQQLLDYIERKAFSSFYRTTIF